MTGIAATLYGIVIIHGAAYLNYTFRNITREMKDVWRDVKILTIDETSFLRSSLQKLDNYQGKSLAKTSHLEVHR